MNWSCWPLPSIESPWLRVFQAKAVLATAESRIHAGLSVHFNAGHLVCMFFPFWTRIQITAIANSGRRASKREKPWTAVALIGRARRRPGTGWRGGLLEFMSPASAYRSRLNFRKKTRNRQQAAGVCGSRACWGAEAAIALPPTCFARGEAAMPPRTKAEVRAYLQKSGCCS